MRQGVRGGQNVVRIRLRTQRKVGIPVARRVEHLLRCELDRPVLAERGWPAHTPRNVLTGHIEAWRVAVAQLAFGSDRPRLTRLLVAREDLLDLVNQSPMARVERRVAWLLVGVHVQPRHLGRIVTVLQAEPFGENRRAVEVERGRLNPRIVRVARVVNVAAVDD